MTERPEAPELTNPRAERVRSVARLSGRSARQRQGRFLVEGHGPVTELLAAAAAPAPRVRVAVEVLYVGPEADPAYAAAARAARVPVRTASDEVLAAMADAVTPQPVLAVAAPVDVELSAVLADSPRTLAVLARVRDPGNAGTVVRAADASGADAVVLTTESVDVHAPKTVRSSAGSLFHVPVVVDVPYADVVRACRAAGLATLATAADAATDLDDLLDAAATGQGPLAAPHAWLLGNEAWGLPEADAALADARVAVPIHGSAESLNLAMAATVCLYASARARRAVRHHGGDTRRRSPAAGT
ncbi:TrmH family RNA methyltransferase [Aquipuribacter nitratireducens]|uniref:TrmH family RNA methyltransferase n=1 Tax=Aquipuribacter nitratireducens TaxID=650104 RepID=A0ABW0GRC6_9MICO